MSADAMIQVRDLHKAFGALEVLRGVDLDVHAGEVVVVIGPSGSGKSTLLRCLNRLEDPTAGHVVVDGREVATDDVDLDALRAELGMVFQRFHLFPHLRVRDNVALGPWKVRGQPRDQARALAEALLARVGLGDKADAWPAQLSGGQQQRVAIARALALEPRALLFDEPTSALDPELVGEVLRVMRQLADDGMTMVVVTHEIAFAREVADRAVFMAEGRIVEQGPPGRIIDAPRHPRTQRFLAQLGGGSG